jgi:hypothetical protein
VQPYCLFPRTPGLFSSLNVQKNMLSDALRMEKFKKAIFETVKSGDVVIDLGKQGLGKYLPLKKRIWLE